MRFFQRVLHIVSAVAVAIACSGCFQLSTVLTVKDDGTGTIQQRMLFTQAALGQLRSLAALGGGSGGQGFDPVSEQQARDAAAALGTGVTYVTSTAINTPEGQGRDITYAFSDISQLRLSEEPPTPGGVSISAGGSAAEHVTFKMTHPPGGNATLVIDIPRPQLPGASVTGNAGGAAAALNQLSPDQMAMFKQMFSGAKVLIAVEPAGRLVRTSSPYVSGNRVTIMDIDLDQLMNNESALARLQASKTEDDVKAALANLPGVKVNTDPQIAIEFAAQ